MNNVLENENNIDLFLDETLTNTSRRPNYFIKSIEIKNKDFNYPYKNKIGIKTKSKDELKKEKRRQDFLTGLRQTNLKIENIKLFKAKQYPSSGSDILIKEYEMNIINERKEKNNDFYSLLDSE